MTSWERTISSPGRSLQKVFFAGNDLNEQEVDVDRLDQHPCEGRQEKEVEKYRDCTTRRDVPRWNVHGGDEQAKSDD